MLILNTLSMYRRSEPILIDNQTLNIYSTTSFTFLMYRMKILPNNVSSIIFIFIIFSVNLCPLWFTNYIAIQTHSFIILVLYRDFIMIFYMKI